MDITDHNLEKADAEKVNRALTCMQQNDFYQARYLLKQAVASAPEHYTYSYEENGIVNIKFWDEDEFLRYVTLAEQHHRDQSIVWALSAYPRAYFFLAFMDVEEEKYDSALTYLQASLRLEPDHPVCLNEIALVYGKIGEHEKAIFHYDQALESRPWISPRDKARALRGMGIELIELKKLDRAQECLLESLKYEPDNEVVFNELLYIGALKTGDIDPADSIKVWRQKHIERTCVQCGKSLNDHHNNKFKAMNIEGNLIFICSTCAIDPRYEKAITINYDYAKAYYFEGINYAENDKLEEAIEFFKKAMAANPYSAEAYVALGLTYTHLEMYKEAANVLKEATMIAPDFPDVFYYLGDSHYYLEQYEEAIKDFTKAVEKNPRHAPSYFSLGGTYRLLGQFELSIESYGEAIKVDPDYRDAFSCLGFVLTELGRNEEAIEACKEAIRVDPSDVMTHLMLGTLYIAIKDTKSAREEYEILKDLNDDAANLVLKKIEERNRGSQ